MIRERVSCVVVGVGGASVIGFRHRLCVMVEFPSCGIVRVKKSCPLTLLKLVLHLWFGVSYTNIGVLLGSYRVQRLLWCTEHGMRSIIQKFVFLRLNYCKNDVQNTLGVVIGVKTSKIGVNTII
jgi:hypothetical protein